MMLDFLGHAGARQAVEDAVAADAAAKGDAKRSTSESRRRDRAAHRRAGSATPRARKEESDEHVDGSGRGFRVIRNPTPAPDAVREAPRGPEVRHGVHGPHGPRHVDQGGGWADRRVEPYGPLSLDPAAAVLHYAPGDLRGPQGVPPGRRLDLAVPAGGERQALPASAPPGSRCPSCRTRTSSARSRRCSPWTARGSLESTRARSTCARTSSRPRRSWA